MEQSSDIDSSHSSEESDLSDHSSDSESSTYDPIIIPWINKLNNNEFPCCKFTKSQFIHFRNNVYPHLSTKNIHQSIIIIRPEPPLRSQFLPYEDSDYLDHIIAELTSNYYIVAIIQMTDTPISFESSGQQHLINFLLNALDYIDNCMQFAPKRIYLHNSNNVTYWVLESIEYKQKKEILMEYLPNNHRKISLNELIHGQGMDPNNYHIVFISNSLYSPFTWHIQIEKQIFNITSLIPTNKNVILLNSWTQNEFISETPQMIGMPNALSNNQLVINFPYKSKYLQMELFQMDKIDIANILKFIKKDSFTELLYPDFGGNRFGTYNINHCKVEITHPEWRISTPFSNSDYKVIITNRWIEKQYKRTKIPHELVLLIQCYI